MTLEKSREIYAMTDEEKVDLLVSLLDSVQDRVDLCVDRDEDDEGAYVFDFNKMDGTPLEEAVEVAEAFFEPKYGIPVDINKWQLLHDKGYTERLYSAENEKRHMMMVHGISKNDSPDGIVFLYHYV